MKGGHFVYKIVNRHNDKKYFGKTSISPHYRWLGHQREAAKGSNIYFHRAIRKYGSDSFDVVLIKECASNDEACVLEKNLIATHSDSYNTALGMTHEQLVSQYVIKPDQYEEFRSLFDQGITQIKMAEHFGCSINGVKHTAERLGLSFKERRKRRKELNALKKPKLKNSKRNSKPYIKKGYSAKYRQEKSRLMISLNKSRGISDSVKKKVFKHYFVDHMTAREVADKLGISKGSVRATVNAAYANMTPEERALKKKEHGSVVRRGIRNSSHITWRNRRVARVDMNTEVTDE